MEDIGDTDGVKARELVVTRIVRPNEASELTALEREQLRIAVRGYDEQDLDAEARLADDNSEESVRGSLEIRSIADEDGTPRYDAFTYFGDAGALFLTGTTEEAGWVGQGGVVLATPDDALRIALDVALGPRARMATPPAGS